MLTKKQLIERLASVPDDALIAKVQHMDSIHYSIYWGNDNDFEFMEDFLKDAPYVPMVNQFNFEMLRK